MRKVFASILFISAMFFGLVPQPAEAAPSRVRCAKYSGRNFIICAESGPQHLPHGLPPGKYHNRKLSSASGPCGMLSGTRKAYGGDSLAACTRYMKARYGSWSAAERFHRRKDWW